MILPASLTRVFEQLGRVCDEFSTLVLGSEPVPEKSLTNEETNNRACEPISRVEDFLAQCTRFQSQIVEVVVEEPDQIEKFMSDLVRQEALESVAILGAEKSVFHQNTDRGKLWIMPSQSGAQIMVAARELIKSNAIDAIIIHEILLKADIASDLRRKDWLSVQLHNLKEAVSRSRVIVVLINPNTSERRFHLSELQFICSHHLELKSLRGI